MAVSFFMMVAFNFLYLAWYLRDEVIDVVKNGASKTTAHYATKAGQFHK